MSSAILNLAAPLASTSGSSADERDVLAVLEGDPHRFEGIVRRWQKPLVNFAFRYVHDPSRAEELAQETFLKCYRSLGQWRRDAQFSTWLFTIALSVIHSHLRRFEPLRLAVGEDDAVSAMEAATPPESLEEQAVAGQRAARIRRAVDTLPALYRDPLIVFYFQEQDLSSTARILGIREGTLKARLHRARERLRTLLGEWR